MPHSFSNLLVHLIFSTRQRERQIDEELKGRLCAYLGGTTHQCSGFPVQINAVPDHVHMLVQLAPTICLADFVRLVKSNSAKWVHETFSEKHAFGWQTGYAAFSVSESNREAVVRYIREQEVHHRRLSFQEELLRYLKRNRIPFDERFIWK